MPAILQYVANYCIVSDVELLSTVSTVDFGSTPIGVVLTRSFRITNLGSDNIVLGNLREVPQGFNVLNFPSVGTLIAPGASLSFSIEFDPVDAGTYSGTIEYDNNDA